MTTMAGTQSPWDLEYRRTPESYVWGTEPSALAVELAGRVPAGARVIDLGCGEGRDSVFFAQRGLRVTGVEASAAGLRKAERLAADRGVQVRWIESVLPALPPLGTFDLVYSCGSIHYVPRRERPQLFARLRALTARGGLQAHIVFTDRQIYEERGERIEYFMPGELAGVFAPDEVLRREERLIECRQDGRAHHHSVEVLLAAPRIG
ncbi:MAG TPA: class I SAM-dependent methyltransferase [Methylomirabilota bacterium]|nr:class I SAM-dependent methyltransferase [Methylomirabilota bacterium]